MSKRRATTTRCTPVADAERSVGSVVPGCFDPAWQNGGDAMRDNAHVIARMRIAWTHPIALPDARFIHFAA